MVVGLIFWFAMKSIFNADKSERQAEARAQAEADGNARGAETGSGTTAIPPNGTNSAAIPSCGFSFGELFSL